MRSGHVDKRGHKRCSERGFVLLVVLWTVGLLALIGSHITASARSVTAQASALRAGAVAAATVDGLVHEAMFRLLDTSGQRWTADGVVRRVKLPRGAAEVLITDEAGRVDLNNASPDLLAALLRAAGAAQAPATKLSRAIYGWHLLGETDDADYAAARLPYRAPGAKFQDPAELALIPGMTPALVQRLLPIVSTHGDSHLSIQAADPVLRRIVQSLPPDAQPQPPDAAAPRVMRIAVHAVLPDGEARREAVVRIDLTEDEVGTMCEILAWE